MTNSILLLLILFIIDNKLIPQTREMAKSHEYIETAHEEDIQFWDPYAEDEDQEPIGTSSTDDDSTRHFSRYHIDL